MIVRTLALLAFTACAWGQTVCQPAVQYSPCDLVFDSPVSAEFRSPRQNTSLVKAFQDGTQNGNTRWIVRFTPDESGGYAYRVNGGAETRFTVTPVEKPGVLRAANVHHFAFVDGNKLTPHLWMGAIVAGFTSMNLSNWKTLVDTRAGQHFNHIGVTLVDEMNAANFQSPEFYRSAEEKIAYANQHGITIDLAFFGPDGLLNRLLPARDDRQKWFAYAISRLAAFDLTWQGIEAWETYNKGRDLLKEIAVYLGALDPYKHPGSSRTNMTFGGLVDEGWLRYRSYQTGDDNVSAIEQQIYQYPAVNNFSSDVTDTDTFRHRLWNATMSGQYPDALIPNEQSANQMKIWYEFMSQSRHWETEPFFDVDGGRGIALEGTEYIIYVEKPGPVTVHIEDHHYDAAWFNPSNGQWTKLKEAKGEVFTADPPDRTHDWVLRISREGQKASMLKSVKFDSREGGIVLQEVEGNPDKVPFEIIEPLVPQYAIKLKRETKALQKMMYEWTGEVTVDNRGYRVIGTGPGGTFQIPANIAQSYPAALHITVTAMNGLGKVYTLDRNYQLEAPR